MKLAKIDQDFFLFGTFSVRSLLCACRKNCDERKKKALSREIDHKKAPLNARTHSRNRIKLRARLQSAAHVVAVNPDAVMVAVAPMPRHPAPPITVRPVPRTVHIIWPVADFDKDTGCVCSLRHERAHQKQSAHHHCQNSFHCSNSLLRNLTPGRSQLFALKLALAPLPPGVRPIFHVRESNPEVDRPLRSRGY